MLTNRRVTSRTTKNASDYIEFETNPDLLHRFRDICSNIFTFVKNWDDEKITPHTFWVFSKRLPAKMALEDFQNRMISRYANDNKPLRMRSSVDIQKSRFSHDWKEADLKTVKIVILGLSYHTGAISKSWVGAHR